MKAQAQKSTHLQERLNQVDIDMGTIQGLLKKQEQNGWMNNAAGGAGMMDPRMYGLADELEDLKAKLD